MDKPAAKGIAIAIPVRRYLKKFVYWNLNLPPTEKIDIASYAKDPIVKVIGGILTSKLDYEQFYSSDDPRVQDDYYNDELYVLINARRFQFNRLHIHRDAARFLDSYLYSLFHSHLLYFIRIMTDSKIMNEVQCIRYLQNMMDLEEDEISFDAIKKASYRMRKEKNLPTFR